MKTVTDQIDAISKAFAAGTICQFGLVEIAGVGNHSTNWGLDCTISIVGPRKGLSRESLEWFCDVTSHDITANHHANGNTLTALLTTFGEGKTFCNNLGVLKPLAELTGLVQLHDKQNNLVQKRNEQGGRIKDKSETLAVKKHLKELETDIEIAIIEELESVIPFDVIHKAFTEGRKGLTPTQEDIQDLLLDAA